MFTFDLCSDIFSHKDCLKRQMNEIEYDETKGQVDIQPSFLHAYVKKYIDEIETIPSFHAHMKKYENQIVATPQINENTGIGGENYELGHGIRICRGLKGFNLGVIDEFKFQDYWQKEYKQKLLHGMKIDDYMKYKPDILALSKDDNHAYEIFEKHLVKQNKILEKYRDIKNDDEEKKKCYCHLMVIRRQSRKRRSRGRYFEACSKFGTYEQGSMCNFFKWCDVI